MGSNYKGELDIESIISAPLVAASKANSAMLTSQVKFLLDTCFEEVNGTKHPVMVKMSLVKSSIDISDDSSVDECFQKTTIFFQVPLISLLPINSLGVNNVDVKFNLEVTSMSKRTSTDSLDGSSAILKGKVARSSHSSTESFTTKSSTQNLNVSINTGTLPLPKGVLELIDVYTKSIQAIPGTRKEMDTETEND